MTIRYDGQSNVTKNVYSQIQIFFLSGLDATHPPWFFFFFSNKAITPTFQNPPHPCMHTGRRKQNKTKQKKTDLVEALHHHVRHVLIKHGGWYDDLVKGFVVAPQSWIGRLLLAAATEAAQRESEREREKVRQSCRWWRCNTHRHGETASVTLHRNENACEKNKLNWAERGSIISLLQHCSLAEKSERQDKIR